MRTAMPAVMTILFVKSHHCLAPGHVLSGVAPRPHTLQVEAGRVWLTMEGEPHDHWLESGATFAIDSGRLVVVEGDRDGSRISLAAKGPAPIFPVRLRSATPALR